MALHGRFHILGEVGIHDRGRVLRQERDALGDGAARRGWRMDHGYRQLVALNHGFCAGTHTCQHVSKVFGGFRFRDVDHLVRQGAITVIPPLGR
jgi:hypothetical protein